MVLFKVPALVRDTDTRIHGVLVCAYQGSEPWDAVFQAVIQEGVIDLGRYFLLHVGLILGTYMYAVLGGEKCGSCCRLILADNGAGLWSEPF